MLIWVHKPSCNLLIQFYFNFTGNAWRHLCPCGNKHNLNQTVIHMLRQPSKCFWIFWKTSPNFFPTQFIFFKIKCIKAGHIKRGGRGWEYKNEFYVALSTSLFYFNIDREFSKNNFNFDPNQIIDDRWPELLRRKNTQHILLQNFRLQIKFLRLTKKG